MLHTAEFVNPGGPDARDDPSENVTRSWQGG